MSLQYFKDFTKAYTYFKVFQKNVTENLSKKCELLQNVHCCCSVTQSCPTFCDPRDSQGLQHARLPCPSPSPGACSNSCAESMMPSNHLILCHLLLFLLSVISSVRVFSNELALCIRCPKYCSFSFSISPSNEYTGLTSFRIDWFDLLAVQGTLKSLLQHHSSKASILWCSTFLMV